MGKKFYQLEQTGDVADLYIYGTITSFPWDENDVSASSFAKELNRVNAKTLNVYISSDGGEVQAGVAIYNLLKRQKAKVRTYCDGFAASIASVIFMAGEERIMNDASALMIHPAWTDCRGNAAELRKMADDLDKITQLSVKAYKSRANLTEEEIVKLMNAETWIMPEEALEHGFATSIEKNKTKGVSQSANGSILEIIKAYYAMIAEEAEDKTEDEETEEIDDTEETEETTEETDGEEENEETTEETTEEETETETEEEPEEAVDDVPEDEEADEEEPADGEEEETPAEDEEEAEDGEEENEEPAQYWSGFFNALIK